MMFTGADRPGPSSRPVWATPSRRQFISRTLGAAVAAAFPAGLPAVAAPKAKPPNFVFCMTDDQAYHTMSCAGSKVIRTPNMDRLAAEGVLMRNAFVTNSLCAPSRASFITGKYSHSHGVRTNAPPLPPQPTFPDYLRVAGYQTGFIGKWHMGGQPPKFDVWLGFGGQGQYWNPKLPDFDGQVKQEQGHVTDLLGDRAIAYLREHRRDPFCLLLWFKSPHRDWQPATRFQSVLEDVTIPEPPTFHDDYAGRPEVIRQTEMQVEIAKPAKDFQGWLKDYYRCILGVDENIGRVLAALDDLGLSDDTLVLHTSDNGFFLGEHHFFDKRLMYEPSIRIPLVLRYPRLMPKGGRKLQQMMLNVDLAPSFLDLAGVDVPEDMHGRSWAPLLRGEKVPWRQSWLYEYYEFPAVHMVAKHRGVRTKRWKYIHYFEANEHELYDLQADPNEMVNLYGKPRFDDKVAELQAEMLRLRRETNDPDLETP